MIQTLKKYSGPFIECFILSSLLLLMLFIFTYSSYMPHQHITIKQLIPIIFFVSGLILNFILYSVLKKKFNFELSVFLYGIGFTSCCFTAVYYIFRLQGSVEHVETTYFYLIPLTILYYSYATMSKNTEKRMSKITLFLIAITAIIFAGLTLFEIINYPIPWVSLLLLLFGFYFAYCLIYKKYVVTLQTLPWGPFLFSWGVFWYLLILRLLTKQIITLY